MRHWEGKKHILLPFGIVIPNPCSEKEGKERREGEGEHQLKKRIKHLCGLFKRTANSSLVDVLVS